MFFTDLFLRLFFKWQNAICLGMFFFGAPLIYMVRDGMRVAPNSTPFTFALMCGPLFLLLPFRSLKTFYRPNTISYLLGGGFLLMSLIYLYTYAPNRGWFTNTVYESILFFLNFYLLIAITTVAVETLELKFVTFAVVISLLGATIFLLFLLRDPTYIIGSRASIKFSEDDPAGNPHIFARGAFLGFTASLIYLKHAVNISLFRKTIVRGGMLIFILTILLTQAFSTFIALFMMIGLYTVTNVNLKSIKTFTLDLFTKWYFWLGLGVIVYKAADFYNRNYELIRVMSEVLFARISGLLNTFFSTSAGSTSTFDKVASKDLSASGRIENVQKIIDGHTVNLENGEIGKFLFGNGYHHLYVDIPVLEPFNSFGLVGQIFFTVFFGYISYQAYREIRTPKSITTEFIAYAYVYFFVYTFTGGLLIDYIRWGFFILVCRFLPLSLSHKKTQ
jgi:hypothetical protein